MLEKSSYCNPYFYPPLYTEIVNTRTQIELALLQAQQYCLSQSLQENLNTPQTRDLRDTDPVYKTIYERRTNCRNCGAPIVFDKCDYCGTINR